jgi:DNA-binding NtrC family response regulator
VIEIRVAALRERADDVLPLLEYYLQRASEGHRTSVPKLTASAEAAFREYSWPGNVRELKNMAERLVLAERHHAIDVSDLPFEVVTQVLRTSPPAENIAVTAPSAAKESPARSAVDNLFARFAAGEDFWTAVHAPFKRHELTTQDLTALIDTGLQTTCGSYRALLKLFNLPASDYKRFHAFPLCTQVQSSGCPVQTPTAPAPARGPAVQDYASVA